MKRISDSISDYISKIPEPPTWLGIILSALFGLLAVLATALLHYLTK